MKGAWDPTIGSIPSKIFSPLPTCQAKWIPIQGRACKKPLHITDILQEMNCLHLSHSATVIPFIYLVWRTWNHKPLEWRVLQKVLRCRAKLNHGRFLMPQPPSSLGHERSRQLARWYLKILSEDPHKKLKMVLLSFWRIEYGRGARPIHYTGILDRTDWTRINLPPRDRYLNVQWLILFSNFWSNQCQSFTL